MQFNKSYRLLRFLNRPHGAWQRYALAVVGWLGTFVVTRSLTLSNCMFREFAEDRFDIAFRKAAWYARRFWSKLDVFNDPFFDFTMGTTAKERGAMVRFVERKQSGHRDAEYFTDLMYIKAADIHYALEQGRQPHNDIRRYYDLGAQALDSLPAPARDASAGGQERAADFSKADAVQALQDIARILPIEQWPWYVVSGTFLGLHREGGFLGHDYDIDLGINAESINVDGLLDRLRGQEKFVLKKADQYVEVCRDKLGHMYLEKKLSLLKLVHVNGLHLDIFIHYTEQGRCWHGSIIHRWENTPFGLTRSQLEGVTVNAPDNPDQYLTENYGDWRTPVKEFDCSTGTPNLVITRNYISIALFLKRFAYFSRHDPSQADRLAGSLQRAGVLEGQRGEWRLMECL